MHFSAAVSNYMGLAQTQSENCKSLTPFCCPKRFWVTARILKWAGMPQWPQRLATG
jgi:hypothetical protein